LPDPERVELADDGVVEPELGVVGHVVGGLPPWVGFTNQLRP
jgi:hypothetical protein